MKDAIKSERREKLRQECCYSTINSSAHVSVAEAANGDFNMRPHSTYSADIATSVFFLFLKLGPHMLGCHFGNCDRSYVMWRSFWRTGYHLLSQEH